MFAKIGDTILVRGHHLGQPDRRCVVLDVHNGLGEPSYVVQWDDMEHQTIYIPGSDAVVVSHEHS